MWALKPANPGDLETAGLLGVSRQSWVRIPVPPLIVRGILGKPLNLSEPQLLRLQNGDNNKPCLSGYGVCSAGGANPGTQLE